MRIFAISTALILSTTMLLALAPTGEAVGVCSAYVPGYDRHCSYLVCVGHSWGYYGESCQYGVRDPIVVCIREPCGPVLP